VADVGRDVAERLGPIQLRDHTRAVIEDAEAGETLLAKPRHADLVRAGVEAVLDQLRERLPRSGWLNASQRMSSKGSCARTRPVTASAGLLVCLRRGRVA